MTQESERVANYNKQFDRLSVNFPKGTKQRIHNLKYWNMADFIRTAVLMQLEKEERKNTS